jgi:hypothetical protein
MTSLATIDDNWRVYKCMECNEEYMRHILHKRHKIGAIRKTRSTMMVGNFEKKYGLNLKLLRELKEYLDKNQGAIIYTNDSELEKQIKYVFPSAKIESVLLKDVK